MGNICKRCGAKTLGKQNNYCSKCGLSLDAEEIKAKSPIEAAAWNLVIAGAGFAYLGQWGMAIGTFLVTIVIAIYGGILGVIICYIIMMILCFSGAKKMNERNGL